jgi:hypothetical protein
MHVPSMRSNTFRHFVAVSRVLLVLALCHLCHLCQECQTFLVIISQHHRRPNQRIFDRVEVQLPGAVVLAKAYSIVGNHPALFKLCLWAMVAVQACQKAV